MEEERRRRQRGKKDDAEVNVGGRGVDLSVKTQWECITHTAVISIVISSDIANVTVSVTSAVQLPLQYKFDVYIPLLSVDIIKACSKHFLF